jgi:glycosyltransferase involved in cell wall biosynthesis
MSENSNADSNVSIIMNCYNGEAYLREAVDSVINQRFQNWELVFWDNQSTDKSAEIIRSYTDPRIKYYLAPKHTKLYEARNFALEKASGRYIGFLDTDDVWLPEKLAFQVNTLINGKYLLATSNYNLIDESSKVIKKAIRFNKPSGLITKSLIQEYYIGILTVLLDRNILIDSEKNFAKNFNHVGDFDLILRLSERNKIFFENTPLACYRIHENNFSKRKSLELIRELLNLIRNLEKRNYYIERPELISSLDLNRKYMLIKIALRNGKKVPLKFFLIFLFRNPLLFLKLVLIRTFNF